MAKNFSNLDQAILDDPVRAARVKQFADEALQNFDGSWESIRRNSQNGSE